MSGAGYGARAPAPAVVRGAGTWRWHGRDTRLLDRTVTCQ
jgi:hypothetical protein